MSSSPGTRAWLGLCAAALGPLVLVAVPVWLIQPFAAQSPDGLWWSHAIKRIAPAATGLALAATVLFGWMIWRAPAAAGAATRGWRRAVARAAIVGLVIVAGGAAWFSRQNHFEWMFRPNHEPEFVAIADAVGVDAGEPVIGVTVADEALAFPITRIGYHHLVNTTIAREPIVATY
jgi:hypothetical protein